MTDILDIQNYLELVCQHQRNVAKKFQKDILYRSGDIPIWPSFSKAVIQLKDRETYK